MEFNKIDLVIRGLLSAGNSVHIVFSKLAVPLIFAIFFKIFGVENQVVITLTIIFAVISMLYHFYPSKYKY